MRRFVFVLVVLAAASCVAAASARDPRAEKLKLNATDTKAARGSLLALADLPVGWQHDKASGSSSVPRCAGYSPDLSHFTITGKAESDFKLPAGAWVTSEAEVYATPAEATGDFKAGAKPQLATCLAKLLEQQGSGTAGVKVKVQSARMVAAPHIGERTARYKLAVLLSSSTSSATLAMDFIVFEKNRTLGTIGTSAVAQAPLDGAALARTMLARVS
jgi:hypothetical protein